MKLQNKDIVNFYKADLTGKRLPLKLSFALKLNKDALKGAVEAYELQRMELITKYAVTDEDGDPIIEDDKYTIKDTVAMTREMNELLEMEIEANITTVDKEILEKCDFPEFDALTLEQFESIYFMISQ